KTQQQATCSARNVRLSATEAYDIDLEHRDMMMKALRFYTQYCRHEGSTHCMECYESYRARKEPFGAIPAFNLCRSRSCGGSTPSRESTRISRCVKMAQCRLRFYDDVDKASCEDLSASQKTAPLPYSKPLLYALEDGDGVLADALGHTYRSTQTRPWSVLPGTLCDDCKRSYYRLFQKTASVTRNNSNDRKLQRSDLNASSQLKVVALALTDSMSQPIPRSVAYQRRNQTTHLWTDSSHLMSRSVPTANFLHRHFSSTASSPRSSLDDSEKTSKARPSSSYSYDGGFFVGAHSGQAEYFVIHPDWVSEAMTVKKASLGDKRPGSSLKRSISLTSRTLPEGRRCLSAPPKQRNPITMEHAERQSAGTKCQQ
ncbi:unnamed protein product, partial [Candidula unifasciata]